MYPLSSNFLLTAAAPTCLSSCLNVMSGTVDIAHENPKHYQLIIKVQVNSDSAHRRPMFVYIFITPYVAHKPVYLEGEAAYMASTNTRAQARPFLLLLYLTTSAPLSSIFIHPKPSLASFSSSYIALRLIVVALRITFSSVCHLTVSPYIIFSIFTMARHA